MWPALTWITDFCWVLGSYPSHLFYWHLSIRIADSIEILPFTSLSPIIYVGTAMIFARIAMVGQLLSLTRALWTMNISCLPLLGDRALLRERALTLYPNMPN